MLKACCDCIAAGIREQNDVYGAETVQLNGRSPRAPSWPEGNSDIEKMFLLPRILQVGDQINVTGLISRNPRWVSVNLIAGWDGPNGIEPDYNNTASQLHIDFDSNEGQGSVILKTIKNGITEEFPTVYTASGLFPDLNSTAISEVTITLSAAQNSNGLYEIDYYFGDSYIDKVLLKHNFKDVRYITLDGAVEKVKSLDFIFA